MGGKLHLKLNIATRPIANKYREGKMKSTLKRELKAREAVERETRSASNVPRRFSRFGRRGGCCRIRMDRCSRRRCPRRGALFRGTRQRRFAAGDEALRKVARSLLRVL